LKATSKAKLKKLLHKKTVLITGGAGSIGSEVAKRILDFPVSSVRVLDIDEHALFKLGRTVKDSRLRLLLGSILDKDRLDLAGNNVDIIIHTAAIKNIEISEYNPIETIDVNINGTVNLIKMAIKLKPKIFVNVSTDKAADPSTLYGSTKQLSERLIGWAGNHVRPSTKYATVRFGNVFESRGNVFEIWEKEKSKNQPLSITDPKMKRYFIHISDVVDFILECLPITKNGVIFVPKMKSYKIKDIASKISSKHKVIGTRRGEKMEEILLTDEEIKRSVEYSNMWMIKPFHE